MTDNVAYTPGTGATVAADDIGGVLHQRIKLVLGADGVSDGDVSLANPMPVTGSVSISGGATSALQTTGNSSLSSIDGKITAVNTGAVVVSSSALPSGASTAARQDTGNTSVASIDTKTPALGQALASASSPVVLTAAQITTLTPPAAITGFALEAGHLAAIDTSVAKIPAQGQALASASMPVVLTAAQLSTLTPFSSVTVSSSALPANAAQETGGNLATLAAKDFATQATLATLALETGGNLEAAATVLGTEADESLRLDEDGTIASRLRSLSEQIDDLIAVQKETQEILFKILLVTASESPTLEEVN